MIYQESAELTLPGERSITNQSNNIIRYQHAVNLKSVKTFPTVCFPVRFIRGSKTI